VKEREILFSSEMVRAILDERKTMTRRVVKYHGEQPRTVADKSIVPYSGTGEQLKRAMEMNGYRCPYGVPGDRLWVRETYRFRYADAGPGSKEDSVQYRADRGCLVEPCWHPSIFMPRWASRITLEVTGVRVERVQDITRTDIRAEGVTIPAHMSNEDSYKAAYLKAWRDLWDSINAKRGYGWDVNPWVWVVEFRRLQP
jgi:hypothetical protein